MFGNRIFTLGLLGGSILGLSNVAGAADIGFTGGPQAYVTPTSGFYDVISSGGAGGNEGIGTLGGTGATVGSSFSLAAGQTLDVFVGGRGGQSSFGGGGGGGTFVATGGSTVLLVAGGGGGGGAASDGQAALVGGPGSGQGGPASGFSSGGGGGGRFSNGITAPLSSGGGGGGFIGVPPLFGGNGADVSGNGAYGGGGGGAAFGGGGAGGYTGGFGGNSGGGGGGGTSFTASASPIAFLGTNGGNGSVSITPAVVVPFEASGNFDSGAPLGGTISLSTVTGTILGLDILAQGTVFDELLSADVINNRLRVNLRGDNGGTLQLVFQNTSSFVGFNGDLNVTGLYTNNSNGAFDLLLNGRVTAVPEPVSLASLCGVASVILARRRRRS